MDRHDGFGLLELIVVVALLALIAGLVLPMLDERGEDRNQVAALREAAALGRALRAFESDTGRPPAPSDDGWLAGPGPRPGIGALQATWHELTDLLVADPGVPHWRGPYVEGLGPDPWGRAYVVNSRAYRHADEYVWVLSAGPDGVVQTRGSKLVTDGDDVGVMVR